MRHMVFVSVLALTTGIFAQTGASNHTDKIVFNGTWWLAANSGERSGFVNGVADCMTWEAHKKGYSATPEQLGDKITTFYQTNPEAKNVSVLDAWQRVLPSQKETPAPTGGETWKNAHWYLNGDWWAQEAETEQFGFVEGYLWCMRTQVEGPHASYSKSASYYRDKVNAFVTANPKLGKEAIATTLARFKDTSR